MTTEAQDTEGIMPESNPNEDACAAVQVDADPVLEIRPLSNLIFLRLV